MTGKARWWAAIWLVEVAMVSQVPAGLAAEVTGLRCEYLETPLAIDVAKPRLSWRIESRDQRPEARNQRQIAYRVLVASTPELLDRDEGDVWDSGKVASDQSIQVEYAGKPLASRAHCHWKVRVWTTTGEAASEPAFWSMGLLTPEDWSAGWIGSDAAYAPPPDVAADDRLFSIQGLPWVQMPDGQAAVDTFFRKQVDLPADRKIRRAVFAVYAYHFCEASINGTVIGEAAHWEATARLDAKQSLRPGANVLTLRVSHTDPYPPAVIGRLVIQFESGDDMVVPVDPSWKASQSAAAGMERTNFDDSAWPAAQRVDGRPWRGPPAVADLARMPAPYLRKEFAVGQKVKRATVYVTALGTYELRLNGERVGRDVLAPGWTEFRKRVHYHAYDVTAQVAEGANAIGAILGDGWYASTLAHLSRRNIYGGRPRLLAQLEIELADGSVQKVVTDDGWKASFGPIRHADLLMGCEYDSRLEMPGWDRAGFNDTAWQPADSSLPGRAQTDVTRVVAAAVSADGGPGFRVQAAVAEPARVVETLPAVKVTEPRPGCWTFDLGQNMVGWVRLKVKGERGQRITVRHGEMTNPDGTIYTAALRSCPATDFFILSGAGEQTLEPAFTFHGFRHVEIRGLDSKPDLGAVTGMVVHTDMRRTGDFQCSHPLVNQLYHNIVWGQKGNYLEVPTDCPQRDERMGWTGDTQFFATTASYNFDVAPFFSRWLQTCEDNQMADGAFPHVVPDIMGVGGATGWGDAALVCTHTIFRAYGDTRIVAERFAAMERYMHWLEGKTTNGISTVGGFGDWLNAGGGAHPDAIDTAYHAHLAGIMADMARAIGREDAAARYAKRHEETKAAFVREFLQSDGGLRECSQTGYALAFSMDLLPPDMRARSAGKFSDEIRRFDWHLATGFIGTPRLLPALSVAGRDDLAYRLLLTDTYPSWLFPVKNGATTMWERWNGWTPDKGFGDISMNSFNHYAFGAVGEYLYGGVGGIKPASPGYKAIVVKPAIGRGLTWADTSFESIHGRIASRWKADDGTLALEVVIPPNTTATVHVPAKDPALVTESGKPAAQSAGVEFLRMEDGAAVFAIGSGVYDFQSPMARPEAVPGN